MAGTEKRGKYEKFQTKDPKKVTKKGNSTYTEPYDHELGDFAKDVQRKRESLVKGGSSKHKNPHAGRTVREDYVSAKTGKPVVKKYSAGEGSGSIPSGTNTHLPGKRKPDGGFYSAGCR
jgi:hypothetical protein